MIKDCTSTCVSWEHDGIGTDKKSENSRFNQDKKKHSHSVLFGRSICWKRDEWGELQRDPVSRPLQSMHVLHLQSAIHQQLYRDPRVPHRPRDCTGTVDGCQLLGLLEYYWKESSCPSLCVVVFFFFLSYLTCECNLGWKQNESLLMYPQ